jgi:hypothetical protein
MMTETDKDAEIAALKAQLASFAQGVKISIPTRTMEDEFHQYYMRGVKSQEPKIVALTAVVSELTAARYAYASEFPLTADGDPDVDNIHTYIRGMKAQFSLLRKASKEVLAWTEITHRPPIRDIVPQGTMALVRLDALADLHDVMMSDKISESD